MQKYADFDPDGFPRAFYGEDVHGPITLPVYGPVPDPTPENPNPSAPVIGQEWNPAYPVGVIPITDEQWMEMLQNTGRRRWNGKGLVVFVPDPLPAPVIMTISDRQFFTQLALDGVITQEEAEATSDGTMPALLMGILDAIPDATERFKVRMLAKNATTFERHQPLVAIVAQALDWGPARLDKLWADASKL